MQPRRRTARSSLRARLRDRASIGLALAWVVTSTACARSITIVSGSAAGSGGAGGAHASTGHGATTATGATTSGANGASGPSGEGSGAPSGVCANTISAMYGTGLLSPDMATSSSTAGGCETNQAGHATDAQCCACIECARDKWCGKKLAAFQGNPAAAAWTACVFPSASGAGGCPKDDPSTPANEFAACLSACNNEYPGVEKQYVALLNCVVCESCAYNCNAFGELGSCNAVPAPF